MAAASVISSLAVCRGEFSPILPQAVPSTGRTSYLASVAVWKATHTGGGLDSVPRANTLPNHPVLLKRDELTAVATQEDRHDNHHAFERPILCFCVRAFVP